MTNSKKLVNLLKKKKLKISFAESCTGGLMSSIITSYSGSSNIFNLGLVTYSNQAKQKILKVPNKIIKEKRKAITFIRKKSKFVLFGMSLNNFIF